MNSTLTLKRKEEDGYGYQDPRWFTISPGE
jgi:hypothetical protein